MTERTYHYRISPGVLLEDIFLKAYTLGTTIPEEPDLCCTITTPTTTQKIDGYAYVYSSMTQILSGGTNGTSLLTGLTLPILLTENTVDIGYYSVFDGMVQQEDVVTNFIFTGTPLNPYQVTFHNTSDTNFKKFLAFSLWDVDWGDGSSEQILPSVSSYSHIYPSDGTYTITLTGVSPWGNNSVSKTLTIPLSAYTFSNPNGVAYFTPQGGNWSGTPISYDYIFSGDSICDIDLQISSNYVPTPFIVSGFTRSRIQDLQVYGSSSQLLGGKYSADTIVTGTSGVIGIVYSPSPSSNFTAYTISDVDYFDFSGGTTLFVVQSSGITEDMIICSALTKNEVLLNVIDEVQVESNIYIERGKNSALESVQRLGEVDNVGDLQKYGYSFFEVKKV